MKLHPAFISVALLAVSSCSRPDMSQPHVAFADKFAHAIAERKFEAAHAMLTPEQQRALSPDALKKEFEQMIAYGPGPATHIEAMQAMTMFPDKKKDDIGWVYVAIAGDSFSEAVAVVVTKVGDHLAIRSVEWGRP